MSETDQPPVKPVLTPKQATRANSTVTGMLISTGICVGLFLMVFFLNPGSRQTVYERNIDVGSVAAQAADVAGYQPLAPGLPEGWRSNFARWSPDRNGVSSWEAGYLTPGGEFIQLTQTDNANPTWISRETQEAPVTGTRDIAGVQWELRDSPDDDASLIARLGQFTIILRGTADLAEFDILGTAVVSELDGATQPEPPAAPAR